MEIHKEIPDSPEGLADYIADELGCPITIEDVHHRIISYSSHEQNVDDARTATIMRRKVPEYVVNGLWKEGIMGKLFESPAPVFVSPIASIGLGNRIAISVWKNKEVLGFIWAQTENVTVSGEQLDLLQEASHLAVRHLMKQRDRKRKKEENVQEFIWQLIRGTYTSNTEIDKRAGQLHVSLKGSPVVVAFEFREALTSEVKRHASYLTETLQQTNIIGRVFDDHHLILLISTGMEKNTESVARTLIHDFTKKLKERIEFDSIEGGYGMICRNPKDLHISYQQALKTLDMKARHPHPLQDAISYQELGVYQFLDEVAYLYEKESFRNETLHTIRSYDEANNTHLLDTLRAFLAHNSHSPKAADALHIHTNTLLYRLKRIREITGIDLADANQKAKLYIDLLLQS